MDWAVIGKITKIKEEYPGFAPFLDIPEIGKILLTAADEGWSEAKLQAAIWDTHYWKTTPEAARRWMVLRVTDPATAESEITNRADALRMETMRLGIPLSNKELRAITELSLNAGLTDAQIRERVVMKTARWEGGAGADLDGEIGATIDRIRGQASEWAVPLDEKKLFQMARQEVAGRVGAEWVEEELRDRARSLFAGNDAVIDAIDRGVSVRQFADPYIQVAAQELEINPEDIDLSEQKWLRPLDVVDQETGKRGIMTSYDWRRHIRTDASYGYDQATGAREQAAGLATEMARRMGGLG